LTFSCPSDDHETKHQSRLIPKDDMRLLRVSPSTTVPRISDIVRIENKHKSLTE